MILHEALQILEQDGYLAGRSIRTLCLTQYFHVVQLDNGSVGSCMNYAKLNVDDIGALEQRMVSLQANDPLLLEWLFRTSEPWRHIGCDDDVGELLIHSLRATVVSALSAHLLKAGGDRSFIAGDICPFDPCADARRAVVIGFGGYLGVMARHDSIVELHVADLGYPDPGGAMEQAIECYRRDHPEKCITISSGHDTRERLRKADVISITGSALCNGTLETLLSYAGRETYVIVQGQSAAIHPAALFRRGVDLVVTTLKPTQLVELARRDAGGQPMRTLLEGGLPRIYCREIDQ